MKALRHLCFFLIPLSLPFIGRLPADLPRFIEALLWALGIASLYICAFAGPRSSKKESLSTLNEEEHLEAVGNLSTIEDTPQDSPMEAVTVPEKTPCLTVYEKAFPKLFSSIVTYLNSTSEPMSESLLALRTSITHFIQSIHKTRDDLRESSRNKNVKEGVAALRRHITEVTNETGRSFTRITADIENLSKQMSSITAFLGSISDIAARVHVLSINASIEAARAGDRGKGFKVISNEIQKLAQETQSFVKTIDQTVEGTSATFAALKTAVQDNRNMLARQEKEDSSTYEDISRGIELQLEEVMGVYAHVLEFMESVDINMNTLSPLAMLHAIITQEIENLENV
jgi:methyl-accepting chemotaxis protein